MGFNSGFKGLNSKMNIAVLAAVAPQAYRLQRLKR